MMNFSNKKCIIASIIFGIISIILVVFLVQYDAKHYYDATSSATKEVGRSLTEEETQDIFKTLSEKFQKKENWLKSQPNYIEINKDEITLPIDSNITYFEPTDIDYIDSVEYCDVEEDETMPFVIITPDDETSIYVGLIATAKYLRGRDYGFIRVYTNNVNSIKALKKANMIGRQTIMGILKENETTFDVYTVEDGNSFDVVHLMEIIEEEPIEEVPEDEPEETEEETTVQETTQAAPKVKDTSGPHSEYEDEPEE